MASYLVQRLHPALLLGPELRVRYGKNPAHRLLLRQGSLDSACGLYSLAMALVLLGLISHDTAVRLLNSRIASIRSLAKDLKETFFHGLTAEDLVTAVQSTALDVHADFYDVQHRACLNHALKALHKAQVPLVILDAKKGHFAHWVVVVGVEGQQEGKKFEPQTLLLLDPGAGSYPYCAFNARLSLSRISLGKAYRYTSEARESRLYRLGGCVVLRSDWSGDSA